ncbi:hypothetical protein [Streptomyces sp. NRRL B-3648]|uniref:hypothetical protein n=1 Tax=Streptomyces sp. NRRL B-3648 TaxID=1519493 RepID=UPI000A58C42A
MSGLDSRNAGTGAGRGLAGAPEEPAGSGAAAEDLLGSREAAVADRPALSLRKPAGADRPGLSPAEAAGADRPVMPGGADPWDTRSGEWLPGGPAGQGPGHAPGPSAALHDAGPRAASPDSRPPAAPHDAGSSAVPHAPGPSAASYAPGPSADPAPPGSHAVADAWPGPTRAAGPRRGAGDPVKALLHRHHELCARAVDPLEVAAGLETHGVTDRTAARFRHRDVFSLAEELYARVPRDAEPRPEPAPLPVPRVRAGWVLLTLLPGALGAATVTGLRLTHGQPRALLALGGLLAAALATRAALRHGPLSGPPRTHGWRTAAPCAWTLWLLGYALAGDGLLHALLTGGPDALPTGTPDGPWPTATAPALALLPACAPAAWSAHLLAAGARRRVARSRGLADFTAAAKPLLAGVFTLFLGAFGALLALCGTALHEPPAFAQSLPLGALLLLARLLTVHRHRHAPVLALGAAAAMEAAALALPTAARLPGCAFLAAPVETLVGAWGVAAVPALACGTAALALLWHAGRTLTRASVHAPTGAPE